MVTRGLGCCVATQASDSWSGTSRNATAIMHMSPLVEELLLGDVALEGQARHRPLTTGHSPEHANTRMSEVLAIISMMTHK